MTRSQSLRRWGTLLLAASTTLTSVTAKIVPADPANDISWPYHEFKTVDFKPPYLNVTRYAEPSEGYLFFAPDGATPVQVAPVIMDMSGELVWNGAEQHAFNFGVYEYDGAPVLGWWNGTLFPEPVGRGNGVIYLYNNNYEQIDKVTLPGNFLELEPGARYHSNIDLHELYITETGTLLVTANNVTRADLTSVGGSNNGVSSSSGIARWKIFADRMNEIKWVVDCLVYEIDIASNKVLFSWSSLDHLDQLPFTESVYPLGAEGYTGANQSLAVSDTMACRTAEQHMQDHLVQRDCHRTGNMLTLLLITISGDISISMPLNHTMVGSLSARDISAVP